MIIVSQDREQIINFDNIKTVKVEYNDYRTKFFNIDFEEEMDYQSPQEAINLKKYEIYAGFGNSDKTILGKYKTKERAIEVLQEIEEQYQKICDDSYFIVYEMPEN